MALSNLDHEKDGQINKRNRESKKRKSSMEEADVLAV